jgi:hypothetical protein
MTKPIHDEGCLLISFMNWLPDEGKIATGTEKRGLERNPEWTGAGWMYREPEVAMAVQPRERAASWAAATAASPVSAAASMASNRDLSKIPFSPVPWSST